MEKGAYVKDIVSKNNLPVEGVFLVSRASRASTRNGDPYWDLVLNDRSGSVEAKIWKDLCVRIPEIAQGSLARISGKTNFYNRMQVIIHAFILLDPEELKELDPEDFTERSPFSADDMFGELYSLCQAEFDYPGWRALVFSILDDSALSLALKTAPAAKSIHHGYRGGLLEHTLNVFRLCRLLADQYTSLDRQALLAAALFHDLGKIREFSRGNVIDYTEEGHLLGHIFLGLEILEPFLAKSGLDAPLQDHFKHLILSHHGQREFGSPVLPQTAEAMALHFADDLDAKMFICAAPFRDAPAGEARRSEYNRALERSLYLPLHTKSSKPDSNHGGEKNVCHI